MISVGHPRLSIAQCRRHLGHATEFSDAEVALLRDQLYSFARVLVDDYARRPRRGVGVRQLPRSQFEQALAALPVEDCAQIEERAAILEYDGRLERDAAQRKSIAGWLAVRR